MLFLLRFVAPRPLCTLARLHGFHNFHSSTFSSRCSFLNHMGPIKYTFYKSVASFRSQSTFTETSYLATNGRYFWILEVLKRPYCILYIFFILGHFKRFRTPIFYLKTVVVAQLVKPEIRGSNPKTGKILSINCTFKKTRTRGREWAIFKKDMS